MLLEIQGLKKFYGAVEALRSADFSIAQGEIVALLGDNGAGKSTLVQILSGAAKADAGKLYFQGKEVNLAKYNVRSARKLGIETVFQDKCLCEGQSLWRNLFVDRHIRTPWGFIDRNAERKITMTLLEQWLGLQGVGLDPDALVRVLSGGERQALAIGRAMYFGASLVILDEPTTALSLKEAERTLNFIRSLKEKGHSVLIISHHIQQAHAVADRFVFMHKGRTVSQMDKKQLSVQDLNQYLLDLADDREGKEHDLHGTFSGVRHEK